MTFHAELGFLRSSIEHDNPIAVPDEELAEMASLCAEELRRRLPRYGVEQGDLDDTEEVYLREHFAGAANKNFLRIKGYLT